MTAKLPLPFAAENAGMVLVRKLWAGRAILEGAVLSGCGFPQPGTVWDTSCPLPPTTVSVPNTQLLLRDGFSGSPVALAGCMYHWVESYRKRIILFFSPFVRFRLFI